MVYVFFHTNLMNKISNYPHSNEKHGSAEPSVELVCGGGGGYNMDNDALPFSEFCLRTLAPIRATEGVTM